MAGAALAKSSDAADPTRAKLIAAAGEVFAEVGFQAATVRDICQRAGANVAAVNYHFRGKLGLYSEVLRQSISANQGEVMQQAIAEAKNPEEALRLLITGMLSRMCREDRPAWSFRLMGHEMAKPTPALSSVVDEVVRPRYNQLRGIISQMLHVPAEHPTTRLCAHSIIGQVIHYAHARHVIGVLWPDLDLIDPKDRQMVSNHIADFTLRNLHALAANPSKRKEKSK